MAETIGALVIAGITAATDIAVPATFTVAGASLSTASVIGSAVTIAGSIGLNYALSPQAKQPKPGDSLISIRLPNPIRQGGYGLFVRVAGSYMFYEAGFGGATGIESMDVLALIGGRICNVSSFYLNDDPVGASGTVPAGPDGRYREGGFPRIFTDFRLGLATEAAYAGPVADFSALWSVDHRGDGIASMQITCLQAADVEHQTRVYPNGLPQPTAVCALYPTWDPRDDAQDPDDSDTWIAATAWDSSSSYSAGDRVIYNGAPFYSYVSQSPSHWELTGATIDNAGSAYVDGAVVLTIVGGTHSVAAQVNVTISGGVIVSVNSVATAGNYTVTPSNPVTVTGGSGGSGAALNLTFATAGVFIPDQSPDKWCSVLTNPVLQLIDYLTHDDHGMGLDREILIDPVIDALMDAADLCDQLVIDANGDYGPRYTSAGKFNFDDDPADVIGAILATCDGWMTEDGDGALVIGVGVYAEPDLVLSAQHIVGLSISYGTADEQVVNELALTFSSPAHGYQEVSGQPWRNEDDIAARGLLRSQGLALKWVQRHSQARRLSKRAMARLSAGHGNLTTTLYGLRALGQRWVKIAYPLLPQMGTDDEPAVVELSNGKIDFMAGTVSFDWVLVDPDTIDAWDPGTEEGDAPPVV